VKLSTTRSIVCAQCKAVVDVSGGVGADLAFYAQDNPDVDGAQPLLPLGATARLALGGAVQSWQVVGYVERCETAQTSDPAEDEQAYWREYLLYSRAVGFAFLIDAEDGWSWSAPVTGAPQLRGEAAQWQGRSYRKLYSYGGQIVYVLGEFYWKLERGQRTWNTDYAVGTERLNREQTQGEVTWSAGQTLKAELVAQAFRLPADRHAALRRDASTFSQNTFSGTSLGSAAGWLTSRWIWILVLLIFVIVMIRACSRERCADLRETWGPDSPEYRQCLRSSGSGSSSGRTGGGSWGGYGSGGGGHK
jgi:hypothetical protein